MTAAPKFLPLTVTSVSADRVDLTWQRVPGAKEYRVYRTETRGEVRAVDREWVASVTEPRHADRERMPGCGYRYLIHALNGEGTVLAAFRGSGETRKPGLEVIRAGKVVTLRGEAFEITWDMAQGGEIVDIRQYDGNSWLRVNAESEPTVPGMTLRNAKGQLFPVRSRPAERLVFEKQTEEEVRFAFAVRMPGLEIGFRYIVFREGVLFCELSMPNKKLAGGRTQGVEAEASMRALDRYSFRLGLPLNPDLLRAKLAWACYPREYGLAKVFLERKDRITDHCRLMPLAMVDYGVNPQCGYTNHVEFFIEDSPAQGAASCFGSDGRGGFGFEWEFAGKALRNLYFLPWDMGFFRTRWGLCLGAARKGPAGRVPLTRADNLTGARIFHTGPGQGVSREMRERWPHNVPPANLIDQMYKGFPTEAHVRRARELGATTIVAHQGWMRSGGSNCEPPADYIPRDPAGLKRFVSACRRHGLRVGLYMRGVEKHALFQPYFERFLKRNVDGLYVDWSSPLTFGYQGCSDMHFSAYACYLFVRALRERVGEKGFLIAHSGGGPTMLAFGVFDAYLPGEFRTQKENFFRSPEHALYYAFASCIATNPIHNAVFGTKQGAAYNAGLGFHPHVALNVEAGPDPKHPMAGLWKILADVPVEQAIVYNSMSENFRAVIPSKKQIFSTVYKVDRDSLLLMASNLGERTRGTLTLNMSGLGLTGR